MESWQKDASELTLEFLWKEFKAYCKPQSNELHACYDLLKKLKQGKLPCDDWYTKLQTQLHLCNYSAKTEKVLLHDLFLFGLEDESFMSKIINEENPEITTAHLQQKLKCMEAGCATAKYIKGAEGPEPKLSPISMEKKSKVQFCQKDRGHMKTQSKVSNKANSSMEKGSSPSTKALSQQPRSQ